MIASDQFGGYVYLCPEKTGTAMMRAWLQRFFGGYVIDRYHAMDVPSTFQLACPAAFRLMTVRNPYERMFSLWCFVDGRGHSRRGAGMTFLEACDECASKGRGLFAWYMTGQCDMALRLEQIVTEVRKLPFHGAAHSEPPVRRRAGRHKPAASFFDYCTDADASGVRRLFAEDFDFFGYPT